MIYVYGLPAELVAAGGTDVSVSPGVGSVVVEGFAPVVLAGTGVSIAPGVGRITIAGQQPTATGTSESDVAVSPGLGRVVVVGYRPTVTAEGQERVLPGGAADRRRKKKRKPQRVLRALEELAVLAPEIETTPQPATPTIEAPRLSDVMRRLDAERAERDRLEAETSADAARRQAAADAVDAERRAADEAAEAQAERVAEVKRQADFVAARSKRLQAMIDTWNALLQRKLDEDEEEVEQLILGAW